MSKRIRDALQHNESSAKKPRRPTTLVAAATGEEYGKEERSCRVEPAMPSTADAACSTNANGNTDGLTPTVSTETDGSSTRWRRLLWISGLGVEDLVLGWFPFSEEDFIGQTYWDEDDDGQLLFDDIWQIKHIQEIPMTNTTSTATV